MAEKESITSIYKKLKKDVYSVDAVDKSTVSRWAYG
jgi:uracil DNA glycosylase